MIEQDGFYYIPTLPSEMRNKLDTFPDKKDRSTWPADFREEYARRASEFTAAVNMYRRWIRKERHSAMTSTAKDMVYYLLDCLNFETGRCDPGHQAIADELGVSLRTVERLSSKIRNWVAVTRRGKMTTNYYRFRVSVEKVSHLLEFNERLRSERADQRERKRRFSPSEPTSVADHFESEPTSERGHEPTSVADHEPTFVSGKHKKGTYEDEHTNLSSRCEIEISSEEGAEENSAHSGTGQIAWNKGKEPGSPLPVPESPEEAHAIIAAICADLDVSTEVRNHLMDWLMRGILSPSLAAALLLRERREAA